MAARKILVLDDDAEIATLFGLALRQAGNQVTVCTRFEEAREYLAQRSPDALLTDIRVGQYNGIQLVHLFRHRSPHGTVVIVTAFDDSVLEKEARALKAEYFVKPVPLAKVTRAFGELIRPRLYSREALGPVMAADENNTVRPHRIRVR
jgi:DNA-binding response OmpR family regulator